MEKPTKSKGFNIFNYLPKPAIFVITNPRCTPGRDFRPTISGPMGSIVPAEARRRKRAGEMEAQEPTSPKISCVGQIKKHKNKAENNASQEETKKAVKNTSQEGRSMLLTSFSFKRLFQRKVRPSRRRVDGFDEATAVPAGATPQLGQMRRFTSGREGLAGFDWRKAQKDQDNDSDGYDEDEDEKLNVNHSAPILMGGGVVAVEPNKEVCIWKRRIVSPPPPLQLSS